MDMNPPVSKDKQDYLVNVTANVTDSADHTNLHEFFVRYVPRANQNITIRSTVQPTTTPVS